VLTNSDVSGATNVDKTGLGKVILDINSCDGTTTVSAGELVIAGNQTLPGRLRSMFQLLRNGSTAGSATNAGTITSNTGTVNLNLANGGTVNQIAPRTQD
jgi:hypothetical protein